MLGLAAAGWFSAPLVLCEQLCPSLQSCVCACHVVIGGSSWPTRAAARASPARLARRGRCRWAGSTPESVLTCWGCYFGLACWLLLGRRSWLRQVEKHVKKNELRESPIAMTVRFGYTSRLPTRLLTTQVLVARDLFGTVAVTTSHVHMSVDNVTCPCTCVFKIFTSYSHQATHTSKKKELSITHTCACTMR